MKEEDSSRSRKAVGVYDRPAAADRPRKIRMIVIGIAIAISVIVAYFTLARS